MKGSVGDIVITRFALKNLLGFKDEKNFEGSLIECWKLVEAPVQ